MRKLNVLVLCLFAATMLHVFGAEMGAANQVGGSITIARLKASDRQMDEIAYRYTLILNNLKSLTPDFDAAKVDMEMLVQLNAAAEKTLRLLPEEALTGVRFERFEAARQGYLIACTRMDQMARRAVSDFENGALSSEESRYLAEDRRQFVQSLNQAKEELKKLVVSFSS